MIILNRPSLELNVEDEQVIHFEYGIDQELPEVRAIYKEAIFNSKGTSIPVVAEGKVNLQELGEYEITYTARYKRQTAKATITIVVEDTIPPVIALVKHPDSFTKTNTPYIEEGFSAYDNYDGDITNQVVRLEVNGAVNYSVADSSGNEVMVERKIVYKDVEQNENVEPSNNAGMSEETALPEGITNSEETVLEEEEKPALIPEDKVVYLTFDDGPGPYTQRLLDILDKYGVKVTFFVTNQEPEYQYLIKEAYLRGHTIALHSYSHNYNIYESEEIYYEDLKKIHDICVEQTGIEPIFVRFPGGTSNSISRRYCKGIMSSLTESLEEHGYQYCDWNVSSGDAEEAKTSEEVAANVISGMKSNKISIVLQHDLKEFSVEAVEEIVKWGIENEYTFLPLTEGAPLVQHEAMN